MKTEIAVKPNFPAFSMPESDLIDVLRTSLYPGAADNSIKMVVSYCRASGLDPMQKPVHIVPMYDAKARSMRDVIMPGIGLYRTQAAQSGEYAGVTEPEFGEDVTEIFQEERYTDSYNKARVREALTLVYPKSCRITVKRQMANGAIVEFTAVELWKENYATAGKDTRYPNAMWSRRPYAQLAKCAEAQALRKAFPESGAQPTADEMEGQIFEQSGTVIDSGTGEIQQPGEKIPKPDKPAKEKPIEGERVEDPEDQPGGDGPKDSAIATEGMRKVVRRKLEEAALSDVDIQAAFDFTIDTMPQAKVNAVLDYIKDPTA